MHCDCDTVHQREKACRKKRIYTESMLRNGRNIHLEMQFHLPISTASRRPTMIVIFATPISSIQSWRWDTTGSTSWTEVWIVSAVSSPSNIEAFIPTSIPQISISFRNLSIRDLTMLIVPFCSATPWAARPLLRQWVKALAERKILPGAKIVCS